MKRCLAEVRTPAAPPRRAGQPGGPPAACQQHIPGTFAFDSYFTNALILNHIHGKELANGQPRGYVGSVKFNRKLAYKGRIMSLAMQSSLSMKQAVD
ncbi:MAG: hypothetical protein IT429_14290 [Gemmataceae bacterium]|nr:hypothetical protein [Gemmataceae bacterium]